MAFGKNSTESRENLRRDGIVEGNKPTQYSNESEVEDNAHFSSTAWRDVWKRTNELASVVVGRSTLLVLKSRDRLRTRLATEPCAMPGPPLTY